MTTIPADRVASSPTSPLEDCRLVTAEADLTSGIDPTAFRALCAKARWPCGACFMSLMSQMPISVAERLAIQNSDSVSIFQHIWHVPRASISIMTEGDHLPAEDLADSLQKRDSVSGLAEEAPAGQACYNEQAFNYFLATERRRCGRTGHSYLFLNVDLLDREGSSVLIAPAVARRLFSGLSICLRETDLIGWYRRHHAVGAVLVDFQPSALPEVVHGVLDRVREALSRHLPSDVAHRLRLRVHQHYAPDPIESGQPHAVGLS